MPDWLATPASLELSESLGNLALRLSVALLLGVCVAVVYLASHGRERQRPAPLATTLVLLSVLIAMVSIVIGNSVARAFSLVGALSIVRFRTVVDDTRDTAFVIFAVIVGMAAGAGLFAVTLIGIPITGVAAVALGRWTELQSASSPRKHELSIRLALGRDPSQLEDVLAEHLENHELIEIATARQGGAIDFTYQAQLRSNSDLALVVMALNHLEGVMSVELRKR